MNLCPHWGEGSLLNVTLKRINAHSYICEECDLIWYHHADAGGAKGARIDSILAWLGYKANERDAAITVHGPVDWPEQKRIYHAPY